MAPSTSTFSYQREPLSSSIVTGRIELYPLALTSGRMRRLSSRVPPHISYTLDILLAILKNSSPKNSSTSFLQKLKFDKKIQCIDMVPKPGFKATFRVHVKMLKVLLQEVGIHGWFLSERCQTPLHTAVAFRNVEAVTELLELGADPNAKSRGGQTPLHTIAQYTPRPVVPISARAIVTKLLERGADINAPGTGSSTPLHATAYSNNVEVASALLEMGADPNAQDDWGCTPLFTATRLKAADIAKVLLQWGADLTIPNKEGVTPLSTTSKTMQKLLTEHKASVEHIISEQLNPIGFLKDLHPTVFAYLHGPPRYSPPT